MTNTENKTPRITKAMRYADILAMLSGEPVKNGTTVEDAKAFIVKEVEQLASKNASAAKRKSAESAKNDGFKALIVDYLATLDASSDGLTCSEIGKAVDELAAFNTSKLSSLCNALVKDGTVIKNTVKGKSLFKLA